MESRCLVEFTSFSENDKSVSNIIRPCGALWQDTPLACFAGLWTPRASVRKMKEGVAENGLYFYLVIDPNTEVKAAHPRPGQVILTGSSNCQGQGGGESEHDEVVTGSFLGAGGDAPKLF